MLNKEFLINKQQQKTTTSLSSPPLHPFSHQKKEEGMLLEKQNYLIKPFTIHNNKNNYFLKTTTIINFLNGI